MKEFNQLFVPGSESGLKRLSCLQGSLDPREKTERLCFPLEEAVYFITGGYGILTMASSGADWDYLSQQDMAIWLSEGCEHYLYNDGEGPLRFICIKIRVDQPQQRPGKEVRRRIARLTDILPEVEVGRDSRIIFRGAALGSERIDTVENATFPSGGKTPSHAVGGMEEIFYILRGTGFGFVNEKMTELGAGDALVIPAGAPHHLEATQGQLLQYVICNIVI